MTYLLINLIKEELLNADFTVLWCVNVKCNKCIKKLIKDQPFLPQDLHKQNKHKRPTTPPDEIPAIYPVDKALSTVSMTNSYKPNIVHFSSPYTIVATFLIMHLIHFQITPGMIELLGSLVETKLKMLKTGILSQKFLDISNLEHRFPQDLKGLEISITLLHNHFHAPTNYVLVYENDFTKATYMPMVQTEKDFHPCSWFYENGKVIPYEFSDQKLNHDLKQIQTQLKFLEKAGYKHYGTTVRPIRNTNELETQTGHIYVPVQQASEKGKYSQTAMDGKKIDTCYSRCPVCIFTGIHGGRPGHISY